MLTSAQVLKIEVKSYSRKIIFESGRPATHCPVVGLFTDVWVAPSIPAVRSVRQLRCKRREIKKQQEKECKECHDTFMKMRLSEERSMKVFEMQVMQGEEENVKILRSECRIRK